MRTEARWEKTRGLSVHRVPGGGHDAVFAFPKEIDAWLTGQQPNGLEREQPGPGISGLLRSRWRVLAAVLVATVSVAALGVFLAKRPGKPATANFVGNELVAWDNKGRVAWRYRFPQELGALEPGQVSTHLRIADLDGDGRAEMLALPPVAEQGGGVSSTVLHCFSPRGKLLWRYEPKEVFDFGERYYGGPWISWNLLIVGDAPSQNIWVAYHHHTWSSSFLVKLDAHGQEQLKFVNAGWITTLGAVKNGPRQYVLAAGLNDEYDAGMLAVLEEDQAAAVSPQTRGSRYWCSNCPSGEAYRYFVFPRTELNRLEMRQRNIPWRIYVLGEHIEVRTAETENGWAIYEFSRDFQLTAISRTDTYWELHQRLEAQGRIDHSLDKCPERTRPGKVRTWSAEKGWEELGPAPAPAQTSRR